MVQLPGQEPHSGPVSYTHLQEAGDVVVLPIGKRSAEYFVHHEVPLLSLIHILDGRIQDGHLLFHRHRGRAVLLEHLHNAFALGQTGLGCLLYTSRCV